MDLAKYIVKARPGVLGGMHEEKRPLRQLSALPVKRYVFINRDSHPDADIYVAIHQAKDLPSPVPDYQVPHCHNTDEFYYFIGNHSDLTGLEGQIIFEGKAHKIVSPACVYIPTGTVHEYKVTAGNGSVTVLFRNRGYTHEDKPFDVGKGERDFARYAAYIFKPEVRSTTEIKYHTDAAPRDALCFCRRQVEAGGGLLHRGAYRRRRATDPSELRRYAPAQLRHAAHCDRHRT
jgi:hypothetical protein